ncbi:MAG: alpha/beta hydrolase [Oligoflexia bacterium]|nr:alpha/beta hydrolase [Oligoflexia bacterium]
MGFYFTYQQIYYEEEGNSRGIPIVLINGGPGGTHHVFHPYFSKIKEYAHVIYYDQRGTGKSAIDPTGRTYTIKQAIEDLESLRKKLNIDRWVVLGWSYGGFLGQCYALTYPEKIMGLLLVASADGLKNVSIKGGRGKFFISDMEKAEIHRIYDLNEKGELNELQFLYNKDLAGDWKRQHYYRPTDDEFVRTARYEWSPAPGFRDLISMDQDEISLNGKFDNFEIPTLIIEGKWDLT